MKSLPCLTILLALASLVCVDVDVNAQSSSASGGNGISMTIYPVVRGADGNQYLITPSGKQVVVPGLGISQDATQVSVYRDQANHFWYTNSQGQQVAVAPVQLEAVQAQINAQSGGGSAPPQAVLQAQSFYSSTPAYAGGYNGIPYGTPVNMEGQGRYSYTPPGGSQQFGTVTPQMAGQVNQWQQQVPYGSQQGQNSGNTQGGQSRMDMRREHRADRLQNRSKSQASDAASDQNYADSKMKDGQTLGTGFRSRKSAREERRSEREDRRADRLQGN